MKREQIIRMARKAGFLIDGVQEFVFARSSFHFTDELTAFAALVADAEAKRIHDEGMVTVGHMREQIAAEREACAKVCYELPWKDMGQIPSNLAFAAAIRARGQA